MNSTADIFDDNWPHQHGTPEGYDNGCRASICPGASEHGLSCKLAKSLSRSDWRYQQLARNGATPAEIAAEFDLIATNPGDPKPKPAKKPAPTPATAKGAPSIADTTALAAADGDALLEEATAFFQDAIEAHEAESPAPVDEPADEVIDEETADEAPAETDAADGQAAVAASETAAVEVVAQSVTPAMIRAWARDRGYEVAAKGTIKQEIVDHYWEAHGLLDTATDQAPVNKPEPQDHAAEQPAEAVETPQGQLPVNETPAARPDFGTMSLDQDLAAARAELESMRGKRDRARKNGDRYRLERDRARDLAARLEQELARSEEQRELDRQERAEAVDQEKNQLIDDMMADFHRRIEVEQRLGLRTIERDDAIAALRKAEVALQLALTKWGEERAANQASHALILEQAHTINTLTDRAFPLVPQIAYQSYSSPQIEIVTGGRE